MRHEIADKSPAAPAQLQNLQASLLYEAMQIYSAELRPFYALFLVLYLLFWISVQDLAACNLILCTAGRHTINLWEASCHSIKKKSPAAVTWAQFMPFSFVLYALYHYYLLLYLSFHKSETAFGCVFIAENLPIGTYTTGDQWAYQPRASGTQSSSSNKLTASNKQSPMRSAAATCPSG